MPGETGSGTRSPGSPSQGVARSRRERERDHVGRPKRRGRGPVRAPRRRADDAGAADEEDDGDSTSDSDEDTRAPVDISTFGLQLLSRSARELAKLHSARALLMFVCVVGILVFGAAPLVKLPLPVLMMGISALVGLPAALVTLLVRSIERDGAKSPAIARTISGAAIATVLVGTVTTQILPMMKVMSLFPLGDALGEAPLDALARSGDEVVVRMTEIDPEIAWPWGAHVVATKLWPAVCALTALLWPRGKQIPIRVALVQCVVQLGLFAWVLEDAGFEKDRLSMLVMPLVLLLKLQMSAITPSVTPAVRRATVALVGRHVHETWCIRDEHGWCKEFGTCNLYCSLVAGFMDEIEDSRVLPTPQQLSAKATQLRADIIRVALPSDMRDLVSERWPSVLKTRSFWMYLLQGSVGLMSGPAKATVRAAGATLRGDLRGAAKHVGAAVLGSKITSLYKLSGVADLALGLRRVVTTIRDCSRQVLDQHPPEPLLRGLAIFRQVPRTLAVFAMMSFAEQPWRAASTTHSIEDGVLAIDIGVVAPLYWRVFVLLLLLSCLLQELMPALTEPPAPTLTAQALGDTANRVLVLMRRIDLTMDVIEPSLGPVCQFASQRRKLEQLVAGVVAGDKAALSELTTLTKTALSSGSELVREAAGQAGRYAGRTAALSSALAARAATWVRRWWTGSRADSGEASRNPPAAAASGEPSSELERLLEQEMESEIDSDGVDGVTDEPRQDAPPRSAGATTDEPQVVEEDAAAVDEPAVGASPPGSEAESSAPRGWWAGMFSRADVVRDGASPQPQAASEDASTGTPRPRWWEWARPTPASTDGERTAESTVGEGAEVPGEVEQDGGGGDISDGEESMSTAAVSGAATAPVSESVPTPAGASSEPTTEEVTESLVPKQGRASAPRGRTASPRGALRYVAKHPELGEGPATPPLSFVSGGLLSSFPAVRSTPLGVEGDFSLDDMDGGPSTMALVDQLERQQQPPQ